MAAAGVATVAASEVVVGGEHEVWPFVIEVFRGKFLGYARGFRFRRVAVGRRTGAWWDSWHEAAQNSVAAGGADLTGAEGGIGDTNRCFLGIAGTFTSVVVGSSGRRVSSIVPSR